MNSTHDTLTKAICAFNWTLPLMKGEDAEATALAIQDILWALADNFDDAPHPPILGVSALMNTDEIPQAVCVTLSNTGHSATPTLAYFTVFKEEFLLALAEQNLIGSCDVSQAPQPIADADWQTEWKKYWKPQRLLSNLVVSPTWETPELTADDMLIQLDPGMAFGTGTHATTQVMLAMLKQRLDACEKTRQALPNSAIDVGTGSGILAFYLAKRGLERIIGIDNHDDAIIAAQACANDNNLPQAGQALYFEATSLEDWHSPQQVDQQFDLVLANILLPVIVENLPRLIRLCKPGAYLYFSGILASQWGAIRDALATYPELTVTSVHQQGETPSAWLGIACKKTGG